MPEKIRTEISNKPLATYKTQTKTAAEITQRSIIPTFFRPANLQIVWRNFSLSLELEPNILDGFRLVTGGDG